MIRYESFFTGGAILGSHEQIAVFHEFIFSQNEILSASSKQECRLDTMFCKILAQEQQRCYTNSSAYKQWP